MLKQFTNLRDGFKTQRYPQSKTHWKGFHFEPLQAFHEIDTITGGRDISRLYISSLGNVRRVNTLYTGLLLLVLLFGFGLRMIALSHTDIHAVAGLPLEDDAFYYFALGHNISAGEGARIDSLHPTNGFQPLWGAINAVVFVLLGESDTTIVTILILGAFVGVMTGAVVYVLTVRLSGSHLAGILAAGLWLFAPQTIRHNLNGMETGLAVLFCLLIFYRLIVTLENSTPRQILLTGLVCGVGFLARVDTVMLSGLVGLALMIFVPVDFVGTWHTVSLPSHKMQSRLQTGLLFAGAFITPVLPWLLFVWRMGKPIIPESGQAVSLIGAHLSDVTPPRPLVDALFNNTSQMLDFYGGWLADFTRQFAGQIHTLAGARLLPFDVDAIIGVTRLNPLVWLAFGLIIVCGTLVWFSRSRTLRMVYGVFILWWLGMTLAYSVVLGGLWFFARYSLPVAEVFGVLAFALVVRAIIHMPVRAHRRAPLRLIVGILLLYTSINVYAYVQLVRDDSLYTWIADPDSKPTDGFYETVQWLDEMTTPDMRVGMFQSGLLSYYSERTALNLDGKVNPEAREALESGRMWDYICAADLDYIADWPLVVDQLLVKRSADWQEDNLLPARLVEAERISALYIYLVNRENCPIN